MPFLISSKIFGLSQIISYGKGNNPSQTRDLGIEVV
jgi:hypothetical protein